ncbi:DUF58 domain-containing protein [Bacillus sp. FJAT-45350]|uniref:DUF58 domain-containing protein n=1 Tax=Bacillus sp. FJAT-45350 TaxID=2011014 RepID=UPI000BB80A20|nr:DUF58 domain-containing protein [Bacillus sp. FJAT-45350]
MTDTSKQIESDANGTNKQVVQTSILFEKYSVWVFLTGLVLAIWFRFIPLIVVFTFLILLSVLIGVWKRKSLTFITPQVELSKSRIFATNEFYIDASVYNDKWLPLPWLEWEFTEKEGIVIGNREQDTYLIRFLWLLWYQKVQWKIKGTATKRGVYNVGLVKLRSGDGFRFSEIEQELNVNKRLYVYPKLVSVIVPPFRPSMQWGVKGKQGGFLEDPLLINGIREYQEGDELRRMNLKATARTGKLQSNVYQPVVVEQLMLYIDVTGFVNQEGTHEDPTKFAMINKQKKEDFEWLLSIITSVAVAYKEKGLDVGFSSNGSKSEEKNVRIVPPSSNLLSVLDQLAEMTQTVSEKNTIVLEEMLKKGNINSPLFIYCERITKSQFMWYKKNRQKLMDVRFFYMYDTDYSKKLKNAKPIDSFISRKQAVKGL